MIEIRLEHICTIPSAEKGYEFVSHSITINGDALFLYKKKPKFKIFGERNIQYKILRQNKKKFEEIYLPPFKVNYPFLDIFSDGSILLVDSRCQYHEPNNFVSNAIIYNPLTKKSYQFPVGDGIEQVAVDSKDNIWVSYFDEGVLKNSGHDLFNQDKGNSRSIGGSGLNCFDSNGNLLWRFDQSGHFILDCYAMNVTSHETHIFYYTDFDFCTISEGFQTKFFSTELAGCSAFAISGNHLLFNGQYNDEISKAYLVTKEGDRLTLKIPVILMLDHGESFTEGTLIGRGKKLHLFTKTDWYAIDAWDAFKQTQASS
ncbi:hypothetical protein [Kiloniella sp.]|uniref:hypothetical protein n=1 Tax=Kiloniella sp. TaxID=1938587 RepID=UPI003B02A885